MQLLTHDPHALRALAAGVTLLSCKIPSSLGGVLDQLSTCGLPDNMAQASHIRLAKKLLCWRWLTWA
jgi:hypothetical protein